MDTWTENGDLYGQYFLYNNEMNDAGDPINFQVHADNNAKIAKSFIGRPLVVPKKLENGEWDTKHIRANSLPELLNIQKKYSIGEIVRTPYNTVTGNHNAVVKFFPEHYDLAKSGKLPKATSPMFAHSKSHFDEDGRLHILDGDGVHLHLVPKGGYPPEISEIQSICEGGLNECMNELKTVAASGQLADFQSKEHFSKAKTEEPQSSMSMEQPQQTPPAPQAGGDAEARIAALEKGFAEVQKMLQELVAKIGQGQPAPAANPAAMPGAAGEQVQVTENPSEEPQDTKTLAAELAQIKAEREVEKESLQKERQTLALQERTRVATEIVENKIKLHRISPDLKDTEIAKLVELQDSDGNPADLTLLSEELKSSLQQLVGASANFAELTLDRTVDQTDINHVNTMEDIGI